MPKMIQIRHVPDGLHRKLKARAALSGRSLSNYLLQELQRIAEQPTLEEIKERLARRSPMAPLRPTSAEVIRAERGRL